jgi:hypothetical protein
MAGNSPADSQMIVPFKQRGNFGWHVVYSPVSAGHSRARLGGECWVEVMPFWSDAAVLVEASIALISC